MQTPRSSSALASCRPLAGVFCGALLALPLASQGVEPDAIVWTIDDLPRQHLDLPAEAGAALYVELVIGAEPRLLELFPYSLRSDDFVLRVQEADGVIRIVEAPAPLTYRGHVIGVDGSDVRGALVRGQLTGIVDLGGDDRWAVQPASSVEPGAPRSAHVVYHQSNGPEVGADACGVEHTELGWSGVPGQGSAAAAMGGTGLLVAEVAFDADVQFFQDNGSSVANSVNDIENVMNGVENIFEDDIGLTFEITQILIRTSEPDPYTTSNPGDLLQEFAVEWSQNQNGWKRDLAHLMTGRNLQGGTLGIAALGCNCSGCYGLSASTFTNNFNSRVGLTAHEMGHQFGAPHCNGAPGGCFIMCSGLGGCSGSLTLFGPSSINTLTTAISFDNCLFELGPPVVPPIFDDFEAVSIDTDLWLVIDGVTTSTGGLSEPSGVRSLLFNALGPDAHEQDELWTNDLVLGSGGPWFLGFFSQHRGVPFGGALVVEIRSSNGNWIEVDRVVSDGVDQVQFEQTILQLPASAEYDSARLRFRTELSGTGQEWYVDDVSLGDQPPCPVPIAYCVGKLNSNGCVPIIMSQGSPSLTSLDEFTISAALIVPQKPGLMVYGYSPAQIPFQGGSLCAAPPVRRTPIQQSGGFFGIPCDGLMSFPMNSHIQSGIDPFLVLGTSVYAQFWYRDQGSSFDSGLSNALEFEICD